MRLRGRELYIIAAVIAAVVVAAWWFLFFSPLRTKTADLDKQLADKQNQLSQAQLQVQRLQALQKTAPQAKGDLVRLAQLVPAETAIPSFIVSLHQTAKASGLFWDSIAPGLLRLGTPFSVEPIDVTLNGRYFDVEDFLYRLENYVDYRNQSFIVTGRLFQVTELTIGIDQEAPAVTADMTVHGFIWSPDGTVTGAPAVQGG